MAAVWRLARRPPSGLHHRHNRLAQANARKRTCRPDAGRCTDQTAGDNMATTSHRALTRVVCRIFIKAAPEAVWDAICPASARYFPDLITIGEVLEADAPGRLVHAVNAAGRDSSDRSGVLSFELRDTLTGYTALTVSCEPAGVPGVPVFGTV